MLKYGHCTRISQMQCTAYKLGEQLCGQNCKNLQKNMYWWPFFFKGIQSRNVYICLSRLFYNINQFIQGTLIHNVIQ